MRVGIIDLGTNSVRFDVHQIGPGKKVSRLHREKLMVRLGQDVFLSGKLDSGAIHRTLQAFSSFRQTANDLDVDQIVAFGTSALREAADSPQLLEAIEKEAGIEVRVISGEEEARLIARGILSNEKPPKGLFTLVDIGGGSTEISICRGKDLLHSRSFGLGAARLQQVFLKTSPPKAKNKGDPDPIDQLRRYIKSVILPTFIAEEWPKTERIIGSSGTILALAKVLRGPGEKNTFERKELKKLLVLMSRMTTSELLSIPRIEAKRVDMILAGAVLLDEVMEALKTKKVHATDYSLRDGILDEQIRIVRQHQVSPLAFHLDDLYAKAKKLGVQEIHTNQIVKLSTQLFTKLARIHRLRPEWKTYLIAAAILHDTGESISPTHHAKHSYYIAKNANFPSMQDWECEFIAQLCLWHTGGKPPKGAPFKGQKALNQAFEKLLAILRIADSLDRSHKGLVTLKEVRVDRNEVRLRISGKTATDLEILRAEQKKDLFERVFHKQLIIVKA